MANVQSFIYLHYQFYFKWGTLYRQSGAVGNHTSDTTPPRRSLGSGGGKCVHVAMRGKEK